MPIEFLFNDATRIGLFIATLVAVLSAVGAGIAWVSSATTAWGEKVKADEKVRIDANWEAYFKKQSVVQELTELYVASHDGLTSEQLVGIDHPPIEWLNEQLAARKLDWRVTDVEGLTRYVPATTPP